MFHRHLFAIAAIAALMLSGHAFAQQAAALSVEAPAAIALGAEQREISITIKNDSAGPASFELEFISPADAVLSESAGEIGPGETKTITVQLQPKQQLAGQEYESVLLVNSGGETISRKMTLSFGTAQPGILQSPLLFLGGLSAGFFSLFSADATGSLFSPETALNVLLAVTAAILLIAFIARFVKRLGAGK